MGRGRRQILIVLGLVFFLGIAAYVKLWTIDYRMSSEEALLLRQQFDLANREAMDESAEWRRRYDAEVDKFRNCIKELNEIKASPKVVAAVGFNNKFEMLRKVIYSEPYVSVVTWSIFFTFSCKKIRNLQIHNIAFERFPYS